MVQFSIYIFFLLLILPTRLDIDYLRAAIASNFCNVVYRWKIQIFSFEPLILYRILFHIFLQRNFCCVIIIIVINKNKHFKKFSNTYSYFAHFYFFLYSIYEESIGDLKILDFCILMDLHVLGYPEHKFTVFMKCLCVCYRNFLAVITQKGWN